MKKLLMLFMFLCLNFLRINAKNSYTVIIDPGHGGIDGGAFCEGIKESDINLNIGLKIRDVFKERGISTLMTRESDISLCEERYHKKDDLIGRVNIINKTNACFYLSIHLNIFKQTNVRGLEILYNDKNESSFTLASDIYNSYLKQFKYGRGIVKNRDLYLLANTNIPGCLIECGFLSNNDERGLLISDDYQLELARIIVNGSIKYLSDKYSI